MFQARRSGNRAYRFALFAGILALHAAPIAVLDFAVFNLRQNPPALTALADRSALTWVQLEIRDPAASAADLVNIPLRPFAAAPVMNLPAPVFNIAPLQDPVMTAIHDYLSCALPNNNAAHHERCDRLRQELQKAAAPPAGSSERDNDLARMFAHDKIVQDMPALCDLTCLIRGALSGNFAPVSYAFPHGLGAAPVPQRGVTGIPTPTHLPQKPNPTLLCCLIRQPKD